LLRTMRLRGSMLYQVHDGVCAACCAEWNCTVQR